MKRTAIQILAARPLYEAITAAARAARQSRTAWVQVACEEKLARLAAPKSHGEPARPVESGKGEKGDAA